MQDDALKIAFFPRGNGFFPLEKSVFLLWALLFSVALFGKPQVLLLGNGGEPKDLDPQTVTGNPEGHILRALFEGLVTKDPKSLAIRPGIAERWEISADRRHYRFFLRQGTRWSNGEPLTAGDFVYSFRRLVNPTLGSEYSVLADVIEGAAEFGKKTAGFQVFAKKTNELEIRLRKPCPYFLELMAHWAFFPVHEKTVTGKGGLWTRVENIVSNGPFALKEWKINHSITVKRNPYYYDASKVKLDEVVFLPISNADTEEKMFRTGKLHSVSQIPIEKLSSWQRDTTGVFKSSPYLGVYFYWINVSKPPLDNVRVRRALALGIDRERITQFVTKGNQMPAQFFTPPGTGRYQPPRILPKDGSQISEARRLLSEAGFPQGKGFPTVELLYNSDINNQKIAEAIQGMWKENLGVPVSLVQQEWKVFLETQVSRNFSLARAGWTADFNDPVSFLEMFRSSAGGNHAGWKSAAYDKWMDKAGDAKTENERFAALMRAESIMLEELPVIPIYIYNRFTLRKPEVKGWFENLEDFHPLKEVELAN